MRVYADANLIPLRLLTQRAVTVSSENRDGRILASFKILAAKIVLKSAVAGAEQTQLVPASFASIRAEWMDPPRRQSRNQYSARRDEQAPLECAGRVPIYPDGDGALDFVLTKELLR